MRKLNNIKPGFGEKRKSFNAKNNKPGFKKSFGEKSSDNNSNVDKPRKNYNESDKRKPFKKSFGGDRELKPGGISDNRNNNSNDRKPYKKE